MVMGALDVPLHLGNSAVPLQVHPLLKRSLEPGVIGAELARPTDRHADDVDVPLLPSFPLEQST